MLYMPMNTPPFLNWNTSVVSVTPSSPLKTIEMVPGRLLNSECKLIQDSTCEKKHST